jgi:hypothetical protein
VIETYQAHLLFALSRWLSNVIRMPGSGCRQPPAVETPPNALSAWKIASHDAKTEIISAIDRDKFIFGRCQIVSKK